MAYEKDIKILAQDFIDLKAAVKKEVARRKRKGDISSYAGTAYDYKNIPTEFEKITEEHINKIVVPLSKINEDQINTEIYKNDLIQAMDELDAKVTLWKSASMKKNATHYCKSSCTGMCTTGCYDECTGCTSCTGSCTGTCTGDCGDGCTGCTGCGTACASGCGGACSEGCSSGCSGGCKTGCGNNCDGTCGGGCSGCTGTCTGGCQGSCYVNGGGFT